MTPTPKWIEVADVITFTGEDNDNSFAPILRNVADYLEATQVERNHRMWIRDIVMRHDEYGRRLTLYIGNHDRKP